MSTRKERRALTFGHMSPNRQKYQWNGKVNFGIQAEINLEERYTHNEVRQEIQYIDFDGLLGFHDVFEHNRRRQMMELANTRLVLWDLTH